MKTKIFRGMTTAWLTLALLGCGPGPIWKPGPKRFHLHEFHLHTGAEQPMAATAAKRKFRTAL